jgi:hypothetical protein
MSVMFLMLGVLSELLSRVYHESQNLKPYKVRNVFRGEDVPPPSEARESDTPIETAGARS